MSKCSYFLILTAGVFFLATAAFGQSSPLYQKDGATSKTARPKLERIEPAVQSLPAAVSQNLAVPPVSLTSTSAACTTLNYACNLTFIYPVPDNGVGTTYEGMRFNVTSPSLLRAVNVTLYNRPSGFGSTVDTINGLRVTVWGNNPNCDPPGVPDSAQILADTIIPNATIVGGSWPSGSFKNVSVDFSSFNISFLAGDVFYITAMTAPGDTGVNLLILGDTVGCTPGEDRWVEWGPGCSCPFHVVGVCSFGFDFNLNISAELCPPITCPADTSVGTAAGECSRIVSFSPTIFPGGTVVCDPPSGSTFPVGTTLVTCIGTDQSANEDTCTFSITVNDVEPPILSQCPTNIVNACATVTFTPPSVSDNCPGATVACTPSSGSNFPVGTTLVTCIGMDQAGNKDTCTFSVTVNDVEPPVLSQCPANIGSPCVTSPIVTFTPPSVSDNCPGVTVACTPPSGFTFPIGVSTVTCIGTDGAGNKDTCTFTVTVCDPNAPHPLDSIIVESKMINAGSGPNGSNVAQVRVYIANKDTIVAVTVSLLEKTLSGNAYMTLSRTAGGSRTFNSVITWLLPSPQLNFNHVLGQQRYHSNSPDSFIVAATFDPLNPAATSLPPGPRRALMEIKFDSVTGSGIVQFDSVTNIVKTSFTNLLVQDIPVNFVKGQVTVIGPGVISGKKFSDGNLNCNPAQAGLRGWPILLSAYGQLTRTRYSDVNGNYTFTNLLPGTYRVQENNPYPGVWTQTCPQPVPPGFYTVPISSGTVATGKDFGNHDLSVWDLRISVAASSRRRGTNPIYYVNYRNNGTVASPPATVTFTLPAQVTPPISISGGGTYASGTVTWTIGPVAAGFSSTFTVRVSLPITVPIGTVLSAPANITPTAGDAYLPNNSYTYRATVLGPSPNFRSNVSSGLADKTVFPEGSGPFGEISKDDTLLYQINFQNVGTDTIHAVVIRDTLDDYLNIETLELQASSHLYDFTVDGRELIWTFNNIDLPDSTTDEPGSYALVTYTVRPDSTGAGLDIKNQAVIYLDSLPLVTNKVSNRLTCSAKGDMNADGILTASDVVLHLNCTFLGIGNCTNCFSDLNCDNILTAADVVIELNYVFLGIPPPC